MASQSPMSGSGSSQKKHGRTKSKSHTYPFECKVLLAAEFANFARQSTRSTSVLLNETSHFAQHLAKQQLFNEEAVQRNFANPVSIAKDAGLAVAGTDEAEGVPAAYCLDSKQWSRDNLECLVVRDQRVSPANWAAATIFKRGTWANWKKMRDDNGHRQQVLEAMQTAYASMPAERRPAAPELVSFAQLARELGREKRESRRPTLLHAIGYWFVEHLEYRCNLLRQAGSAGFGGVSQENERSASKRPRARAIAADSPARPVESQQTLLSSDSSEAPPSGSSSVSSAEQSPLGRQSSRKARRSSSAQASPVVPASASGDENHATDVDKESRSDVSSEEEKENVPDADQPVRARGKSLSDKLRKSLPQLYHAADGALTQRVQRLEDTCSTISTQLSKQERLFEQQHNTLTSVLGIVTEMSQVQRAS